MKVRLEAHSEEPLSRLTLRNVCLRSLANMKYSDRSLSLLEGRQPFPYPMVDE
jgi:hypothetical protein